VVPRITFGVVPDAAHVRPSYTADVPRAPTHRARPRQWRDILAFALAQREAIGVRSTVINHLRGTPRRAEITAARRAPTALQPAGKR
jgi:nucleotide-binding universal stress UspA family protein